MCVCVCVCVCMHASLCVLILCVCISVHVVFHGKLKEDEEKEGQWVGGMRSSWTGDTGRMESVGVGGIGEGRDE